jgi:peptide chain release factor subunit 3
MGTIVSGKLESGIITKGQNMLLMPNRVPVQVLTCMVNDNETEQVCAGDNFQLKLKGVEDTDIQPGFVLCVPEKPCSVGRIFDAEVRFFGFTFNI